MGYITIGILAFTIAAILFGTLFGMMRGRNRAIVRLCLIVVSAVLAILLRGVVTNIIFGIKFGPDGTLEDILLKAFSGETEFPEQIQSLVLSLVKILIGTISYFIIFIVLRLLTWLIIFPIIKIFVKKGPVTGENAKGKKIYKKRKGWGALVGFFQGVIVAFLVCAPLTGMVGAVDKISSVKMNGKDLIEIPSEIGVHNYMDSFPGKLYDSTGNWYFDIIASGEDEEGNSISINTTVNVVVTVAGLADAVGNLGEDISKAFGESSGSEPVTPEEKYDAMRGLGDTLIEIDKSIQDLGEEGKELVSDLLDSVKEIITEEGEDSSEFDELFESFDINNIKLGSAGEAINSIADYMENVEDEDPTNDTFEQEDVNAIVKGLADNKFIIDLVSGGGEGEVPQFIELNETDKAKFESAIADEELTGALSAEDKETLKKLLGVLPA